MHRLAALVLPMVLCVCGVSAAQECLHGPNESAAERERREYAVHVATEINKLQAARVGSQPGWTYARPSQLKLPEMPDDFGLTFFLDGRRYMFTLKDDKDPCNFGIFSDHDGLIYATMPEHEATVRSAPDPNAQNAR